MALDGRARFDLDRWNTAYFDRLRGRVDRAAVRGIYVAVMPFSGLDHRKTGTAWRYFLDKAPPSIRTTSR